MYTWNWEPSILIGLALQVGAYLACIGPLRGRFPGAAPVPQARMQTFLLGSLVLFIALVSPIDTLGDRYLLSAHMVQHMLITLVAPPLLLIGTPPWMFRPLLRLPLALPLGRWLTSPLVAFFAYNITFSLWHVPRYYEATLQSLPIHIIEHVHVFFDGRADVVADLQPAERAAAPARSAAMPVPVLRLAPADDPGRADHLLQHDSLPDLCPRAALLGAFARDRPAGGWADHVDPRRAGVSAGADDCLVPLAWPRRLRAEPGCAAGATVAA